MRLVLFAVLAALVTALGGGTSAYGQLTVASTHGAVVTTNCTVNTVKLSGARITSTGRCVRLGRTVPSKITYSFVQTDSDGYGCPAVKGTALRSRFSLTPAIGSSVTIKVRYLPSGKYGRLVSRTKTFRFNPERSNLQCGRLGSLGLPDPASLCDPSMWPSASWNSPLVHCGRPVPGGLGFAQMPRLVEGRLDLGPIASASGACVWRLDDFPGPYVDDEGVFSWNAQYLYCPKDGVGGTIFLWGYEIYSATGRLCTFGYTNPARMFVLTDRATRWRGRLNVLISLGSYKSYFFERKFMGAEYVTASFHLDGTEEPC